MYCKNCGNKLHKGDRFCNQCGAKVENSDSFFPTGPDELEPKPEQKVRKKPFHITGFDWDLEGFPDFDPGQTEEADFNWSSVVESKSEEVGGAEDLTEDDLFSSPKSTKDESKADKTIDFDWTSGDTLRIDKAQEEKTSHGDKMNVYETVVPEDKDLTKSENATADSQLEATPEYKYDKNTAEKTMAEGIAAAQKASDSKIDKFYTFNKKNEEFQALLDQEYERLKKRIREEDEAEQVLEEKARRLEKARNEWQSEKLSRPEKSEEDKEIEKEFAGSVEKELSQAGRDRAANDQEYANKDIKEGDKFSDASSESDREDADKIDLDKTISYSRHTQQKESEEDKSGARIKDEADDASEAEEPAKIKESFIPVRAAEQDEKEASDEFMKDRELREDRDTEEESDNAGEIKESLIPPEKEEVDHADEDVHGGVKEDRELSENEEAEEENEKPAAIKESPIASEKNQEELTDDHKAGDREVEKKETDEADEIEENTISSDTDEKDKKDEYQGKAQLDDSILRAGKKVEAKAADKEKVKAEEKISDTEIDSQEPKDAIEATQASDETGQAEKITSSSDAIEPAEEIAKIEEKKLHYMDIFEEDQDHDDDKKKKSSHRGWVILLDILIIILLILAVLSGIMYFKPESQAAYHIRSAYEKILNRDRNENKINLPDDALEQSALEKAITSLSGYENIKSFNYDDKLRMTGTEKYPIEGAGKAETLEKNNKNISKLVETVATYVDGLYERKNTGSDAILDMVEEDSSLYSQVSALTKADEETEVKDLTFGEIEYDEENYFIIMKVTEQTRGQDGEEKVSTRIMRFVPDADRFLAAEAALIE